MPTSMNRVRVAMIGAGRMANRVHYPSLASFDDAEIAAICDLDAERLTETADQYGVEGRYRDYRRMVEEVAPDAVYAIGPPHIMFDVWTWCLRAGLNLFVEKPMGITLHQARILAHLAEQHDCVTQVGFQRRGCPMVVELRNQCLARGPIVHAVCSYYKHGPEPYLEARDRMMDDGIHAIDTLRWMCGGEVVEIQSLSKRVATPDLNFFSALLHFDNGATGILVNNWSSGRRIFKVEMHAPGICVEAEHEDKGYLFVNGDTDGIEYDTRVVAGSDDFHIFGGFLARNREFVDAVKASTQPQSNFADALKSMDLAERILAQALLDE